MPVDDLDSNGPVIQIVPPAIDLTVATSSQVVLVGKAVRYGNGRFLGPLPPFSLLHNSDNQS